AALAITSALGAIQGLLITRLRLPSFVVTLAGLLGFEGVMIQLLGAGGTIPIQDEMINNLANGTLSPLGGWLLTAAIVVIFAIATRVRVRRRRKAGLVVPPFAVTVLLIIAAALAGIVLVTISNIDRGIPRFPLSGMPWAIPIVFAVLVAWSFV